MNDLAQRIKSLRLAAGWTIRQVAKKTQVSKSTINYVEKNERSMSLSLAVEISKLFNITLSDLIGDLTTEEITQKALNFYKRWGFLDDKNKRKKEIIQTITEQCI